MRSIILLAATLPILALSITANAAECPATIPSGTVSCDVITQYGITWTLADAESVGQFANGDYYILDDGSVTVSEISPSTSGEGETLRNGSMINPTVYPMLANAGGSQGFDGRAARYRPELTATFPITLPAGSVLISSISVTTETIRWDGVTGKDSHDALWSMAYLTVMSNSISDYSGYFRPAPTDRSHTLYPAALDLSWLPSLNTAGMTAPTNVGFDTPMAWAVRGTQRPWPLWVYNYNGRYIHAMSNMFSYHRETGSFLSKASMFLASDMSGKEPLAKNIVQIGIDMYHAGILGKPDSTFYMLPILFAGKCLDNSSLLNAVSLGTINGTSKGIPRDFPDFYYIDQVTPAVTSAIVPVGQLWRGNYRAAFRNNIGAEYEHLDPTEFSSVPTFSWSHESSYRVDVDSFQHIGMILFAHVTGLKDEWGHDPTFDYADYWMALSEDDHMAECAMKYPANNAINCTSTKTYTHVYRSGSEFIDSMWDEYRNSSPHGQARRLSLGGRPIKLVEPGP